MKKENFDIKVEEYLKNLNKKKLIFKIKAQKKEIETLKEKNNRLTEKIAKVKINSEIETEENKNNIKLPEGPLEIEDFICNFSDNLKNIGLKDYNDNLAMHIYSILSNKENLLLVGDSSIDIANAFSNTICSKNVDIINIPIEFSNSKELIDVVQNCKGEVVVINNMLDAISEDVCLPLLKLDIEKTLIFTVESKENLGLISNYLYDYLVPIDIDDFINPVIKRKFIENNIDISFFNSKI